MSGESEEPEEQKERPLGKVDVILRILGQDLVPEEVTTLLGLTPSQAFKRGDPFTAGGRSVPRAFGVWTLSTHGRVQSEDLTEHCRYLLNWVSPIRDRLKVYLARPDVSVAVAFWWEPTDGPAGFTLPSDVVQELTRICGEFEFYFA